jgi:hypothetical protein
MAASDYDFTLTRQELIEAAFSKLGVLPDGQPLSAEMSAKGVQALNLIIKQWNSEGIHFWGISSGLTESLIASQSTITLPTDPFVIGIDQAFSLDGADDSQPIELISMQKYENIHDKTSTGRPYWAFVQNFANSTVVKLYPVCDKAYTFRYTGITRLKDWDNSNDKNLIPERFLMSLLYGLCSYLAEDYKIPVTKQQSLQAQYQFYFSKAKKSDVNRDDRPFVRGAYD